MTGASYAPKRVLFIDDDEALTRLVQKYLQRNAFKVETAFRISEGYEKIQSGEYDVVALDQSLPDGYGIDLLEKISQLSAPPPVVFVTGDSETDMAVKALQAGAADYVVKSVSDNFLPFLAAALTQAISLADARRRLSEADHEVRRQRDRAELLLREINHRVGNSLSLVASLVRMQADTLSDGVAKEALEETQSRIVAIGRVHASLNLASDVQYVDIAEYLESLCAEIAKSYASRIKTIEIKRTFETAIVTTDRAVALGLIVTELVINALKYAYPEGKKGEVRVELIKLVDGRLRLTVEDDGMGISVGANPQGTGLGGQIVEAMSESLDCQPVTTSKNGTRVMFTFAA